MIIYTCSKGGSWHKMIKFGYVVIKWDLVQDKMSNVFTHVYLDKTKAEECATLLKQDFPWLDYRIGTMVID